MLKACVRARATWVCLSVLSFDIGKLQGEEGVTGQGGGLHRDPRETSEACLAEVWVLLRLLETNYLLGTCHIKEQDSPSSRVCECVASRGQKGTPRVLKPVGNHLKNLGKSSKRLERNLG